MMDWTPELEKEFQEIWQKCMEIDPETKEELIPPRKLMLAARERDAQTIADLTKRVKELEDKLLVADQKIHLQDGFSPDSDGGDVAFTEGA